MAKIKYLDATRKTSFIGEIREIEELNKHLEKFEKITDRKLTVSDFIRWAMTKFNEEKSFREEFFKQFRPGKKDEKEKRENEINSVFS